MRRKKLGKIFSLFLLSGLLSGLCLGDVIWDNDNFIDGIFWAQNPSDEEVLHALYGSDGDETAYTLNWSGYNGECDGNNVLYVQNLPSELAENTVYVLDTGAVTIELTVEMSDCSAIISKTGTTFYSNAKLVTGINLENINYAILDNISMDGVSKVAGGVHTKSTNGIRMYNSSNNTINNFEAWDWGGAGIYALYSSNNNNIQNTKVYNSAYGIRFYSGGNYNVINNVMTFNFSTYGIQLQGSYNSVNNTQIFNGGSHGISMHQWPDGVYNIVNNSQIYNISQHALFVGENRNVLLYDAMAFNNKFYGINNDAEVGVNYFYGNVRSFDNGGDPDHVIKYSIGGDKFSYLGWTAGKFSTGITSRDMMVNPKNKNGNYLLNWDSWFQHLQGNKTAFTGKVVEISFGDNVKTQQQPVYRKGDSLVTGWSYDENKFIGSNIEKIREDVDLNFSDLDIQQVNASFISNVDGINGLSIYGNIQESKENLDVNENVQLNLNRIGKNHIVGQYRLGDTLQHKQEIVFVDEYRDLSCSDGWDNDNFLDESFWSQNPSDENIICALYGKNENDTTAYTQIWDSEYHDRCYGMQVVETGTLPTNLTPNTIYVLNTGAVITAGTIWPKHCNAIISKSGSTIYSSVKTTYQFHFYGSNYGIMDNLTLDGTNNGKGGKHAQGGGILTLNVNGESFNNVIVNNSNYGLYLQGEYHYANNIYVYDNKYGIDPMGSNNVINNAAILRTDEGITTRGSNNTLNNIIMFNNVRGIDLWEGQGNVINNAQIFNNSDWGLWIDGDPDSAVINNVHIYNNNGTGLIVETGTNLVFNDLKIYNNGSAMDIQNSSNLKYYGDLEIFGNGDDTNYLEKGGNEHSDLGWSKGVLKTGEMTWSYITNPMDIDGNYMLDWQSDSESLRGIKDGFSGIISGYSYGMKIVNQVQPVARDGQNLVKWGSYNSDNYIGSDVTKLSGDIYVSGDEMIIKIDYLGNALIIGKNGNENISEFNTMIAVPMESGDIILTKFGSGNYTQHYGRFLEPSCEIEYNPKDETYGNVLSKVICNYSSKILNNGGKDNYLFQTNGTYDFEIEDIFGKTGTLQAKVDWIKVRSSGGGGGGSSLSKDNCPNGDYSDSYYDGTCGKKKVIEDSSAMPQNDGKGSEDSPTKPQSNKTGHNSADEVVYDTLRFNPHYSDEMNKAYQFAYHYGITTKTNIKDAAMNWELTRIAMAKMLSQYAINVLGIKPDTTKNNDFTDVSDKLDSEYDDGVTLAYQLGIMGINMPNNEFKPYNYVTRAEFATALSRLLYHTSDGMFEKTSRYYVPHINKLAYEGILTNTDPAMKELRGYVMLMLMRSAK